MDRIEMVDSLIMSLTELQAKFPDQEILVKVSGNVVSCKLGDAVIFEGAFENGPMIVIDAE